ncbi:ABC transporter substrate-binding protein [Leucothrix pacifica]|uniref:Sugar-binding protein n=1 Tax=Leucothrix pacifica TaxID=1247513 RepID=A0A317CKQ7_9GAMM|nr:extracellular solute-binding protein [Leucothrix pacifica]PWQ96910.1 sugar-binding protein [Leucothrix pacifica]
MKRAMNLMAAAILTASSSMVFAQTDLSLWYHGAGNDKEKSVLTGIINDFNGSQDDWKVNLAEFPQESYNESVVAAALSGKLPDILDVDGPLMPNWAWSKYLTPLEITDEDVKDFLPGTIGRYDGKIYSVGLWDAAVALFARKSVLEKHELRIPTLDKPWSLDEFNTAINTLKMDKDFEYPLDLGLAWKGEWYAYAFGPLLQSWGGDLMDVEKPTAEGVLNGDEAMAFGEWWQNLFTKKLVPGTSQDGADRETGFLDGKYAMQWNGNWAALAALEKFGDDLLFLPAPDMGKGPKIGAASWQFGVSGSSKNQKGANDFIRFAMQDKYLANFSNATGLIPATAAAAKMTENYKEGGKLSVFYALTDKQATKRAVTPAYNVATLEFEKALSDIANGADVADTLDAATDAINKDLEKNKNYK